MRIFFYDETKEKKKTRKELWKDYERSRACSRDVSLAWHDTRVDFTWSTLNWRFVRSIFRFSIQSSSCRHVTRVFSCLLLFLMVNKHWKIQSLKAVKMHRRGNNVRVIHETVTTRFSRLSRRRFSLEKLFAYYDESTSWTRILNDFFFFF